MIEDRRGIVKSEPAVRDSEVVSRADLALLRENPKLVAEVPDETVFAFEWRKYRSGDYDPQVNGVGVLASGLTLIGLAASATKPVLALVPKIISKAVAWL